MERTGNLGALLRITALVLELLRWPGTDPAGAGLPEVSKHHQYLLVKSFFLPQITGLQVELLGRTAVATGSLVLQFVLLWDAAGSDLHQHPTWRRKYMKGKSVCKLSFQADLIHSIKKIALEGEKAQLCVG